MTGASGALFPSWVSDCFGVEPPPLPTWVFAPTSSDGIAGASRNPTRQLVALTAPCAGVPVARPGRNGTRSALHTALRIGEDGLIADRAVSRPDGNPPPGMTHCPAIRKCFRPGSVLRSGR